MLNKVGVVGEVVVLTMFEDKDAVILQQSFLEDDVRDGRQFFESVWRIGKDEVVLLTTGLQKAEHIATKGFNGGVPLELLETLLDEAVMVAVEFDADDAGASPREQFEGDAARACEEVEGFGTVEVDVLHQHVEDVLLGKIGGRPRLERTRNIKMPPLVFSSYYSHIFNA